MIKDYLENDLKTNNLDPLYKIALEELVIFLRQPNTTLFRGFIGSNQENGKKEIKPATTWGGLNAKNYNIKF